MSDISLDEFRAIIRDGRPVCKECGFTAHSLVSHLRDTHKLSPGQYVKKHPNCDVASPVAMELLRHIGKNPMRDAPSLAELASKFSSSIVGTTAFVDTWKDKLKWYTPSKESMSFIQERNVHFKFTKNAPFLALAFEKGRNIFISGPTGCGKTEEVKQIFSALGFPVRRANMHGDVTYGTFVGSMKANAQGTYFDYGILPHAMKHGYPVLLDEIDFTPPNIASVLFPVLEKDSELYIPETGEHIKPAKGFMIFATGNTGGKGDGGGQYTGTEVMNSAFLDRFSMMVNADYLPPADEIDVVSKTHPTLKTEFIKRSVVFANELRTAFQQGDLSFTWSTRKVLDFMDFVEIMTPKEALDLTILNWLDKDDKPFVEGLLSKVGLMMVQPRD